MTGRTIASCVDALITGGLVLVKPLLLYAGPKLAARHTSSSVRIDRIPATTPLADPGGPLVGVATVARSRWSEP